MFWQRNATVLLVVVLGLAMVTGMTACSSGNDSKPAESGGLAPPDDPNLDKGLALVESKCDLCHTLDRIKTAQKDAAGWDETVSRMRKHGAVLTDDEAQQIIDYLASR